MKLWILKPREDLLPNDNPWEPWYDKAFGFVVRAEAEEHARQLAQRNAGDESYGCQDVWISDRWSTCEELTATGEETIVIRDFAAA